MGKATSRKRKTKTKLSDGRITPTAEAMANGEFISAGMAFRRIPVIDTMLARKQITVSDHAALGYYRDQASTCDVSPKSCLDRSIRGSDHGPSVSVLSATLETARIERDLGQLRDIARAIAVDDMSLSQWCISQFGGRERYDGKGRFVAMVPNFERRAMAMAIQDLKMAAHRIVR